MTDYYVDATGGDDGDDGSMSTPWQTVSQVNGSTFSAGDNIYFKKGEVWRETLDLPSSGSSGSPITFGAYGSGAKPRITGADVVSSFSAVTSEIGHN